MRAILLAVLAAALLGGCSSLTGVMDSQPEMPEDPAAAAEALSVIAKLQQANQRAQDVQGRRAADGPARGQGPGR